MNGLYIAALGGFIVCAFLLMAVDVDTREMWQDERDVRDTLRAVEDEKERQHYFAEPYDQDVDNDRKDDPQ